MHYFQNCIVTVRHCSYQAYINYFKFFNLLVIEDGVYMFFFPSIFPFSQSLALYVFA